MVEVHVASGNEAQATSCHKLRSRAGVRHIRFSLPSQRLYTMAYTRAVAVVLGTLLALTQTEVEAGVAHAHVYSSGSGAAQSQVTEPDGTVKGQCAYSDPQGNSIKISYRQSPNGHVEAEADPPMQNAAAALETCRRSADAAAQVAQDSIRKTQQEIFRQQQELQQQIFHQNQAFQQSFQFPKFFAIPPQFPFGPNF